MHRLDYIRDLAATMTGRQAQIGVTGVTQKFVALLLLVWSGGLAWPSQVIAQEQPLSSPAGVLPQVSEAAEALFADSAPTLAVTLTGAWFELAKDKTPEPKPRDASLMLADGTQLSVRVSPRGKSRRLSKNCQFPPVLLDFKRKELAATLFAGQNKLKLVTHCGRLGTNSQKYMDQLHSEFLLYQIFNRITPVSFRTRMLDITWVDAERGKRFIHPGFLIEHKSALAKRLGGTLERREKLTLSMLDGEYAALAALFAYLAGNTDFSFIRGPEGDRCCHNALPVRFGEGQSMRVIPYDFDATGFVDPNYAQPAQGVGITKVSQRIHRGYCEHKSQVPQAIVAFQAVRPTIVDLVTTYPAISAQRRKKLLRFVEAFYKVLDNPKAAQRRLIQRCR